MSFVAPVQIDDRDPSISYFGSWFLVGTNNPDVFDGTLSITQDVNSGFRYTFTGVQISVYGVGGYSGPPPIVRFRLDNDDIVTFTAPSITNEQDNLLWFQSAVLSPGSHHIDANVSRASSDSEWSLDYIIIQPTSSAPPPPPTTNPSPPASPTTSNPPPSSSPTSTPTSTPTSAPTSIPSTSASNSSSSSSTPSAGLAAVTSLSSGPTTPTNGTAIGASDGNLHKSSNVGPIVGGVVGGMAVIALLVLGLLFLRRKNTLSSASLEQIPVMRENVQGSGSVGGNFGLGGQVTPYLLPREREDAAADYYPSPSKRTLSPTSSPSPYPHASTSRPLMYASSASDYSSTGQSIDATMVVAGGASGMAGVAHSVSGGSDQSQHSGSRSRPTPADSGLRFPPSTQPEDVVSVITAPPAYTRN